MGTLGGYEPTSSNAEDWVKLGKAGKLLGTFPVTTIYRNELAIGEIYWINDPTLVGLRYPDNSRMAVSAGWLQYRDQEIRDKHYALLKEYNKLAGVRMPLRLKHRVQRATIPGKLQLKERPAQQPGRALSAPPSKGKLRLKPKPPAEGHASGAAASGPRVKPKLILKR